MLKRTQVAGGAQSHTIAVMQENSLLAAIDLGSNSFRLEIGRYLHDQIHRVEYHKETVRQGIGLDADRNLTAEAMQRGWSCLARFAERLASFEPAQVRAVATQTLREARNRDAFIERAQQILGFPIEVISGKEEARLIYLGVAHLLPESPERRLVVDIGGRSTELVLGQGLEATELESYRVGSVAWSMRYFGDNALSPQAFERAEIAAKAVLDEALGKYPRSAWDTAYGASGTIGAVADILQAAGREATLVTRDGVNWLKETVCRAQSVDRLRLDGLKEDRRAVLAGGISVLSAVMELLDIDTLHAAQGALRHGALYELVDLSDTNSSVRTRTVLRLQRTFNVDLVQAQRVSDVARHLFEQIAPTAPKEAAERWFQKLNWAAQLHEIGGQISHSDYHKHGAYILDNSDAAGFALPELHRLAQLVLGHRGKLRKLNLNFDDEVFVSQLLSLRLAVILAHARIDPDFKVLQLQANRKNTPSVKLSFPETWAQRFPQSAYLLGEEARAWEKTGLSIKLQSV
jgi:exopolyphosphatase / guanosine-5'-triphosphate,3'-diphosphate pyrophosphatase